MRQKEKIALIKENVTMPDILNAYGFDGNAKRKRLPCPIHDGDNREGFSFNDELFQCFICGAKGDVISFVQHYCDLDFNGALTEINKHFRLWDDATPFTFAQRQSLNRKVMERQQAKEKKERALHHFEEVRLELCEIDAAILKYAPKSMDEEVDERYIEALHRRDYAEYLFEITTKETG